jgi:hypothetical protein
MIFSKLFIIFVKKFIPRTNATNDKIIPITNAIFQKPKPTIDYTKTKEESYYVLFFCIYVCGFTTINKKKEV